MGFGGKWIYRVSRARAVGNGWLVCEETFVTVVDDVPGGIFAVRLGNAQECDTELLDAN